ncbi:unnamed protein product [Schistosoma turkestanicum]|nr:unnamed protein product [Schistosoma turkestanicum]
MTINQGHIVSSSYSTYSSPWMMISSYMNAIIFISSLISSIYYPIVSATSICLSPEQLIALSNSKNTYRFEAEIIQLDKPSITNVLDDDNAGLNAFVKITRILKQPQIGNSSTTAQLQLNELVHVNQIRSKDYSHDPTMKNEAGNANNDNNDDQCLPQLERGKTYEWITYVPENINELSPDEQKQLILMPGGIFPLVVSQQPTMQLTSNSNSNLNKNGCAKRECRFGAICEEWFSKDSDQFIGVCVCPTLMDMARNHMCNMNSGTICTINGLFYLNECVMLHQACLKQTELKRMNLNVFSRILSQSDCSQLIEKTSSAAAAASIPATASNDQLPTNNINKQFTSNRNPSSSIQIRKNSHHPKTDENPQHDSPQSNHLTSLELMNPIQTNPYKKCPIKICSNELNSICDLDGTVYQNECFLKKYTCQKFGSDKLPRIIPCNSTLQKYKPKAELCGNGNLCLYGGKCYDPLEHYYSAKNNPMKRIPSQFSNCICEQINCLNEWPDPVCADDGETYTNQCFLKRAICETQSMKRLLYRGNCGKNLE